MRLISTRTLQERIAFARATGASGCLSLIASSIDGRHRPGRYRHPAFETPLEIRIGATDFKVCRQWSGPDRECSHGEGCRLVIDAGANIGASSLRLAARFPGSRVVAIELEPENHRQLQRNTSGHPRVEARHAGLWSRPVSLQIDNTDGGTAWAHFAVEGDGDATVPGVTIEQILDDMAPHGIDRVDVLKIDIEGGELEVLRHCEAWIDRVDAILIELHEDDRPGVTEAFEHAVREFPRRWREGELVCVARAGARIREPGS